MLLLVVAFCSVLGVDCGFLTLYFCCNLNICDFKLRHVCSFDLKVAGILNIESRHQPLQTYLYLPHKPSIEQTLSLFLLSMSGCETCPQLSKWASENAIPGSAARRTFTSNDRLARLANYTAGLCNIRLKGKSRRCVKSEHCAGIG